VGEEGGGIEPEIKKEGYSDEEPEGQRELDTESFSVGECLEKWADNRVETRESIRRAASMARSHFTAPVSDGLVHRYQK
jgi:hypothetical protein